MYKIDHPFFLKYICEPACDELSQPGKWPLQKGCRARCASALAVPARPPSRLRKDLALPGGNGFQAQQAEGGLSKPQGGDWACLRGSRRQLPSFKGLHDLKITLARNRSSRRTAALLSLVCESIDMKNLRKF